MSDSQGKNIFKKFFSYKSFSHASIVLMLVLLLPIFYLSTVDRATGDDLGYSFLVRDAWNSTHSLLDIIRASFTTVKNYYYGWQGTWFDIFLFSFQPECFGTGAYVIVPFLSIFAWLASTLYLFKQILVRHFGLDKYQYLFISLLFWLLSMEFIPGTKSSIFFYNGCAHYIYPFSICQVAIGKLIVYYKSESKAQRVSAFILFTFLATLMGGANYPVALLTLLIMIFFGGYNLICNKGEKKKVIMMIVPFITEGIGLIISALAPGNSVHGEDFGFSLKRVLSTVFQSFVHAFIDGRRFLLENPIQVVGMLLIFVLLVVAFEKRENEPRLRFPIITSILLLCTYAAMEAPLIYAQIDDASQGSNNINYQVFYLVILAIEIIWAERLAFFLNSKCKRMLFTEAQTFAMISFLFVLAISVFRGNIKTSTSYESFEYIVSGQAADFKAQMLQLDELLADDNLNPVVPYINDVQGPLMHMPITDDNTKWTNHVYCQYYHKDSITAVDREEWNRIYSN